MLVRISVLTLLIFSVVSLPWFFTFALFFLFGFYFKNYYEMIAPAFIFDILYSLPADEWWHPFFLVTICTALFLLLVGEVRKRIFIYH